MSIAPSPRGAGWYLAGTIALLLFGLIHTAQVVATLAAPPTSGPLAEFSRVAHSTPIPDAAFGPFHPTAWHTVQILNITMSVLTFLAVALNWVARGPLAVAGNLRSLAAVNVTFLTLLGIIPILFEFPPPGVLALLVALLFAVAWLRLPR